MKPLTSKEYLRPVGNECLIPSHTEAVKIFASQNLFGHVSFGIAHTSQGDCLCWLLTTPDGHYCPVKAFQDNISAPVERFTEIQINSMFNRQERFFKLVKSKDFKLLIKEIRCFPTEAYVFGYAHVMEYSDVIIHAVKIYQIEKKQKFLFPAWYIETSANTLLPDVIFPMFTEDRAIMKSIPFNKLNWIFMDPPDTFLHNGEIWQLFQNEKDGLYINKLSKLKFITKKEEG